MTLWDGTALEPTNGDGGPTFSLRSPAAFGHVLRSPGQLGLGRAYVAGEIDVDDMDAALELLATWSPPPIDNRTKAEIALAAVKAGALRSVPKVPEMELRPQGKRHSILRDKRAVTHHYNLSNDYFALFLDESMTYSCALWSRGAETLEEAQRQKLELVCTKLALQPGMRVLDVGCGWGSFAVHAAREHGVHVTGITLSEPQASLARQRAAEAGVGDRVDIRVMDYREIAGETFDAVASIGMVEHVGSVNIDAYSAKLASLLEAGRAAAQSRHRAPARGRGGGRARSRSATCSPTPRRCTCRGSACRWSAPGCTSATSRTSRTTTRARCWSGSGASSPTSRRRAAWAARSACACGGSTCGCRGAGSTAGSSPSTRCARNALKADVVVIGSGMGGATAAWGLARRGADVLVLERGERIPREPANWSPEAVFRDGRYKPAERWADADGREFAPGVHYVVGGNTKVYGASLPRLRESDFVSTQHDEGVSPAWPFSYADLEPYYGEAERLYRVHGVAGDDPTAPWRSSEFPYPAVEHEPYVADLAARLTAAGVHPSHNAMGIDLRPGGTCVRSPTCDGFPCFRGAKSDAETCALDPALATGNCRLATGVRVRRLVARGGRIAYAEADGGVRIEAERFVLSAGAANSAALLLASGVANGSDLVGRNFMMHNNAHIVAVDLSRRNDVVFQKTLSVNDWYHELGALQLIGKVQGAMMGSAAPRGVPPQVLDALARRSVEWIVMAEDFPSPANRVSLDRAGRIVTARRALGTRRHRELWRRAKRLLRACGYDFVLTQWFDIAMNSHMCGTVVCGQDRRAQCSTHGAARTSWRTCG